MVWPTIDRVTLQLEQGTSLATALDATPELLTQHCRVALRLAEENGDSAALAQALLAPSTQVTASSLRRHDELPASRYFRLISRVFFVSGVVVFIFIRIIPEFKAMYEEFGVEPPELFVFVTGTFDLLIKLWFVIVPSILLMLLLACLGANNYLRRWNPLIWRQADSHPEVSRRQILAMLTGTSSPLKDGVKLEVGIQSFASDLGSSQKPIAVVNGNASWQALTDAGVLQNRERQAVAESASAETRAWLLRRLAEKATNPIVCALKSTNPIRRWVCECRNHNLDCGDSHLHFHDLDHFVEFPILGAP